jgi:hypothetical protein
VPTIESTPISIAAELLGETDRAWLLCDGVRKVWLPKSIVDYDAQAKLATMPEWLGREKRLI